MSSQNITFQGKKLTVSGTELKPGDTLPDFKLTGNDMSDLTSAAFQGAPMAVVVVPSLDTPVCSTEGQRFNSEAGKLGGKAKILIVSRDLPFAQKRWCGAEGVENVVTASDYKYQAFGKATGTNIDDWALLARAVFIVDKAGKVTYVEYVPEISSEPNYEGALAALKAVV